MDECGFMCAYDRSGRCSQDGGECLKDDCPEWMDCNSCKKADRCEI